MGNRSRLINFLFAVLGTVVMIGAVIALPSVDKDLPPLIQDISKSFLLISTMFLGQLAIMVALVFSVKDDVIELQYDVNRKLSKMLDGVDTTPKNVSNLPIILVDPSQKDLLQDAWVMHDHNGNTAYSLNGVSWFRAQLLDEYKQDAQNKI